MEFGKVERTLSKKLNSTVIVYKSKSKPGYVYRLTVKMEMSMCVADAANWGNIELAVTDGIVSLMSVMSHISSSPT